MGYTKVINMPPGMASNPYNRPKEQMPIKTLCELCNRTVNTRDWPQHKNSKAHRALEQAEKYKENAKSNNNGTDSWGGVGSGFTPDGDFNLASADSGNDGWGSSGSFGNTQSSSGYGNKTGGGGGDRACFGCGEVGHTKRDCPKAGSSGGGGACYGCGEVGHNKRDCPKSGSSGGGQACFNCGLEGYVIVHTYSNTADPAQSPQD